MSGPAYFATSLGNATFEGAEWDIEFTPKLGLKWKDPTGGPPTASRTWANPYIRDVVDLTFTLWTNGTQAQVIENQLPGGEGGAAWNFDLALPGLSTNSAIPGFGNFSGGLWTLKNHALTDPIESMGRKAPGVDLYGYRFKGRFSAIGGAAIGANPLNERGNAHPVGIQSVPAVLSRKFIAHQIQVFSKPAYPLPIHAPIYTGVRHGLRPDAAMSLDHLTSDEADEVVTWFRGQRDTVFSLASQYPFGPGRGNTVNAISRGLTVNRGAGWWWDLKLDLSMHF
jgi:hypothetical protein